MFKTKLTEETRYVLIFISGILGLLLIMFLLNYFLEKGQKPAIVEKEKEKTVIVTQPEESGKLQKPLAKSVVSTVRDAIKQGNYSTAYMEINKVSKTSPEYEEISRLLAKEAKKRKAPGVRKESGATPSAPIRYLDESTPRDRTTDAVYIYFLDVSGTLVPRFCIQATAKKPIGITGFIITADNRKIELEAPSIKSEDTGKVVAEWYDVILDRRTYETVQAMIRARKVTLTVIGNSGKTTRDVTNREIKGFRRILDGYTALGGSLNYLQDNKTLPPAHKPKRN